MDLLGVAEMDQFFRPFFLTSLIIGMVVLIFLEKRKGLSSKEGRTDPAHTLRNTTADVTTKGTVTSAVPQVTETVKSSEVVQVVEDKEGVLQEGIPGPGSSSSCSSSGSEEEQASQSLKASKQAKKKKHACKGSVVICATKRKVTGVSILTDSQDQDVQVSLEGLAGEIRSQGITCTVHPAFTHLLPSTTTEPSHLHLLFGTSSEGCQGLQESVMGALGGEAAVPPPQPFLYSVACWSEAAQGPVYECGQALSGSLVSCGGAEWLPITCITTQPRGEGDGESLPPVMDRQQYVTTVMEKLTKPAKKCCGTSCGSKTVDIEDLAASLLLSRPTVTS